MNILQKWRDRRAQKRKLRELATVSSTFATLDRLMASGLLSWQPKTRQMLIAEPLATIFMQTAEKWQAFIRNLYRWTYYQQCQEAWEKFFEREELKAVRDAMEDGRSKMEDGKTSTISHQPSALSREDIERIRRARRAEISQTDMEPPVIKEFDFFIIPETTEAHPEPIAVGHYNAQTQEMEMATWEEVRSLLVDSAAK